MACSKGSNVRRPYLLSTRGGSEKKEAANSLGGHHVAQIIGKPAVYPRNRIDIGVKQVSGRRGGDSNKWEHHLRRGTVSLNMKEAGNVVKVLHGRVARRTRVLECSSYNHGNSTELIQGKGIRKEGVHFHFLENFLLKKSNVKY